MVHYVLNEDLNHKKKVKLCLAYSLESQGNTLHFRKIFAKKKNGERKGLEGSQSMIRKDRNSTTLTLVVTR